MPVRGLCLPTRGCLLLFASPCRQCHSCQLGHSGCTDTAVDPTLTAMWMHAHSGTCTHMACASPCSKTWLPFNIFLPTSWILWICLSWLSSSDFVLGGVPGWELCLSPSNESMNATFCRRSLNSRVPLPFTVTRGRTLLLKLCLH